jgi:hypothetical protein
MDKEKKEENSHVSYAFQTQYVKVEELWLSHSLADRYLRTKFN